MLPLTFVWVRSFSASFSFPSRRSASACRHRSRSSSLRSSGGSRGLAFSARKTPSSRWESSRRRPPGRPARGGSGPPRAGASSRRPVQLPDRGLVLAEAEEGRAEAEVVLRVVVAEVEHLLVVLPGRGVVARLGAGGGERRDHCRVLRVLLRGPLEGGPRVLDLEEAQVSVAQGQVEAGLVRVELLDLQQGLEGRRVLAHLGPVLPELQDHGRVVRGELRAALDRLQRLALVLRLEVGLGQVEEHERVVPRGEAPLEVRDGLVPLPAPDEVHPEPGLDLGVLRGDPQRGLVAALRLVPPAELVEGERAQQVARRRAGILLQERVDDLQHPLVPPRVERPLGLLDARVWVLARRADAGFAGGDRGARGAAATACAPSSLPFFRRSTFACPCPRPGRRTRPPGDR